MLLLSKPRVSPRQRWLRRGALVALILLGLAVWRGHRPALDRYHAWKQERALGRAKAFLAQNDPASAKLEIEIALAAVPGGLEAIRTAADLLDQVGSSQALILRRRLVEAASASVPDRLAMASTALRLRDFNAAREALVGIPGSAADDPAVLRANLAYALALDLRPVADALLDRMNALGQQTTDTQALHALLLRLHPNPEKAAAARRELETLAEKPEYALAIHRALYADAIVAKDFAAAKRHAALVAAAPAATFADRLNEANLALLIDKRPFETVFAALKPAALADGPAAAELIRWLLVQNRTGEAARWAAGLPAPLARTVDVLAARADLAIVTKDWPRLGELLAAGAWGPLAPELVNNALASRTQGADNPTARKAAWKSTLAAAGGDRNALNAALRLARVWRWEDEIEQTLWAVVRADPTQAWAHTALMTGFRQRGDGAKMLDVVTLLKNSAPQSVTYRHDWALLSLLAAPTAKWDAPKETARELALAEPANATYATAYALALAQAGKIADARRVIEKLPAAERDYPPRAPYLAFVYGLARQPAEFDRYAALARPLPLLKEERRLLAIGEFSLGRNPPPAEAGALLPSPSS